MVLARTLLARVLLSSAMVYLGVGFARVTLVMRKPNQVIGNLGIFRRQTRLVAIAAVADPEGHTRQLDADFS
ncbi:hypothetical protein D3C76_1508910 [compost metagenome]